MESIVMSQIFTDTAFTNKEISLGLAYMGGDIQFVNCKFEKLYIHSTPQDPLYSKDKMLNSRFSLEFLACEFDEISLRDTKQYGGQIRFTSGGDSEKPNRIENLVIEGASRYTHFEHVSVGRLEFREYGDPSVISGLNFERSVIHVVEAETSRKRDYILIDHISFDNCSFDEAGGFNHLKLKQNVFFDDCDFTSGDPLKTSTFRHIKNCYGDNGNDRMANYFGSLELKSQYTRKQALGYPNSIETRVFKAYDWINSFGLDTYKPFWTMVKYTAAIALLLSVYSLLVQILQSPYYNIYIYLNLITDFAHNYLAVLVSPISAIGDSGLKIITSNSNIRFLDNTLIPFIKFVIRLYIFLLWFFLILGIRKRFKIN